MTNKKNKKTKVYTPVKNLFLIGQKVIVDGRLAGKIDGKKVSLDEPIASIAEVVQIFKPFTDDSIGYMVEIVGGEKAPTLPETSVFTDKAAFDADIIRRELEVLQALKKKYRGDINLLNH